MHSILPQLNKLGVYYIRNARRARFRGEKFNLKGSTAIIHAEMTLHAFRLHHSLIPVPAVKPEPPPPVNGVY